MPGPSPEMGGYQRQEAPRVTPERQPIQPAVEALPVRGETMESQPQATTPAEPVIIPALPAQPILPKPAQTPAPTIDPTAGNPAMASDDDLIEKVWVDKAKKIIQDTKGDPYAQEREVSKLQADYIKKRYGKDIKIADE